MGLKCRKLLSVRDAASELAFLGTGSAPFLGDGTESGIAIAADPGRNAPQGFLRRERA
jgi:hypothetical protein